MLKKSLNRGFGMIIVLAALLIVAVLAYFNWDRLGGPKKVEENLGTPQQQVDHFKEQADQIGKDLQKNADEIQKQIPDR